MTANINVRRYIITGKRDKIARENISRAFEQRETFEESKAWARDDRRHFADIKDLDDLILELDGGRKAQTIRYLIDHFMAARRVCECQWENFV